MLHDFAGSNLNLEAWWTNKPSEAHAISIQIFDADNNKVAGQDFTIGLEPLARYQADLSSLEPGDYTAKLIVYNYETRVSVPGRVASTQTRFDRELEIGLLAIE
jgi:hypothetical protein